MVQPLRTEQTGAKKKPQTLNTMTNMVQQLNLDHFIPEKCRLVFTKTLVHKCIASLLAITKNQKQPNYSTAGEWLKTLMHPHYDLPTQQQTGMNHDMHSDLGDSPGNFCE